MAFLDEPEVEPQDPATRGIVERAKRSFERYRAALGGRLDEQRPEDEQIPDTYGQNFDAYQECLDSMVEAVPSIVAYLKKEYK